MANKKTTFTVSVVRESGVVYYGDCASLTVPSLRETITVLPYHTPIIMKLGAGDVIIKVNHEFQKLTQLKNGLLYVGDNEAVVLADL